MSSRHRDKVTTNDRMETSKLTTPDKRGEPTQNVSPGSDMSAPRTDSTSSSVVVPCQRERRRREHNDMEKKRKEQIKACICRMGELLPATYITSERQSTLETVEKSLSFMIELKDAKTKFSVKEESMEQEINQLKTERDKLLDIIKSAGLSSDTIPTNGVSSTTDVKDDKPKAKTKKRTTLNNQIQFLHEQREKERQSEQEIISSSVSAADDTGNGQAAAQMNNMPGGAFLNGQNIMFNPMMMQNGNQLMMPGMMGMNGNQLMGPMGMMTPNGSLAPGFNGQPELNKSAMEDSDAGLLQLAMQDAGITPNSNASQPGSSAVTPSIAEAGQETESTTSQSNPLQTLASVATSQDVVPENSGPEIQSVTPALTGSVSVTSIGSTMPVMSSGAQNNNFQNLFPNNNNNLINMPMMGQQPVLAGQQQQPQTQQQQAQQPQQQTQQPTQQTQQIMFVNEQGIPMIANVPLGGLDPNTQNNFNNLQKQGMLAGINPQGQLKDQSGGMEQNPMNNALAMAQHQANMAALLGQSANLQNMAFQQQNLLSGNIIQTPNGQFIQQINPQAQMQQLQGQGQLVGVQGQGQGIVVGGPQGNQNNNFMNQFTLPNQQSQLPSALILPNGQIIPVVTNPSVVNQNGGQNFAPGQGQVNPARMSGPQMQPQLQQGAHGQVISGSGSQGLLMTASSGPQGVSTSAGASLNTSVVPTSAIQSVMTTQIQGSSHVQTHKTNATSGSIAQTDVSQSTNQPKLMGLPANIMNPTQQQPGGAGLVQPGGKSGATPILISLPINGQPTTVLLDPVTMQVLGTVQPQQGAGASVPGGVGVSGASVAGSQANHSPATSHTPTTSTSSANKSKNNKNNANQRAICPKPSLDNEPGRTKAAAKKKKASKSNKSKETVQPDSLSDNLQIQIPESTTDPETTSAISSESTDILAKAAESIFSSPLGEMTTVGGFYNPANEDNPLHIDTSAAEADDENNATDKNDGKLKRQNISIASSIQNSVIGLNSVGDGGSVSVVNSNEASNNNDNVTSLSATLEELAGIKFGDAGDIPMDIQQDKQTDLMDICMETPNKPNKKAKVVNSNNKNVEKKDTGGKQNKAVNAKSGSKKSAMDRLLEMDKSDTDSQMDIESTLIHIPEAITFSENDISDVLDQVEKLGNSPLDSPKPSVSNKKSKSKRSKMIDSDGEPSSKKRKGANKEGKEGRNVDMMKDVPLSMPSAASVSSVYDFDGSDDIVPSILPLNAKDFSSLSSKPGPTDNMNKQVQVNVQVNVPSKGKPQPAQKGSKASKPPKEVEAGTKPPVVDISNEPLFAFPDNTERKKDKPKERSENPKLGPSTAPPDSLPSMPDFDTTTSLFGYVVPKKLQRPDTNRQPPQVSPKPPTTVPFTGTHNSVVSTKTSMVSPKQAMLSPKTSIVSPKDSTMSPEPSMDSPKLTIVSPNQTMSSENDSFSTKGYSEMTPSKVFPEMTSQSQGLLPLNNSISPGKSYSEMTPVKKRALPEKTDDLKVSPFSALNSDSSGMLPFAGKENMYIGNSAPNTQSMGVITSVKSGMSSSMANINDQIKCSSSDNQSVPFKPVISDSSHGNIQNKISSNVVSQKQSGNIRNYPQSVMIDTNFNSSNLPPPSSYKNVAASSRAPASSASSQNNQFGAGPQFMHDSVFNSQTGNTNKPMGKETSMRASPISSVNNYPTPYTAESLFTNTQDKVFTNTADKVFTNTADKVFTNTADKVFTNPTDKVFTNANNADKVFTNTADKVFTNNTNKVFANTHQDKVIKSPPNVNISTNPSILNQQKADHANMSKNRNNAYSVDNFVQNPASRENSLQMRNEASQPDLGMTNSELNNPTNDFTRLQNENSPDGFSIATIGLNLTPITSTTPSSSFMDLNLPNSSSVISTNPSSSSFSFSLSTPSTRVTTTSPGGLSHHQFPFYPTLSSSATGMTTSGSNDNVMPSMSNMGMFPPPHGNSNANVIQRNNTVMHPSGSNSNIQRGDNPLISRVESSNISQVDPHPMPRNDNSQSHMPKDVVRDQGNSNKPSCSKQPNKMPKPPNHSPMQEPFNFPTASSNEPNFFHDAHMKTNLGKNPSEQMRKPPDPMPSHSRSGNPVSHQDKRGGPIDRSPQMMNSAHSFYSPHYPPGKSLNTPPLHHHSLMPPDDRIRNMSNRSPYDVHYPPSSQPYSSMAHNYPNRFDGGASYSRDNAGTQPLSHTPINSGGRKSANPQQNQQTSVVKPPPKQSAPPLVPMAPQQQPPASLGPRPTPPQSHRSTTPLANPPQPTPAPQVNPSRQSKAQSRNSKAQKKSAGNKNLPFVEVDSNLSNSIFETNRSMTPFFPMQNLSPQSRAMQHEGSPFLHGNFFPGPRFPNSNTPMPKNSDLGPHFNPLFAGRGPQNGLGLNFQPGFGMNSLHGNHGNGPQITPHSAPHMANFSLNNIFSDSGSQNESSLNISPIKFPHANFQHQGMDPNAMQQHHPYNRGHPSVMSINSILGPNHHGFDGRMNTSMAGFHGHGHPSFIPPLNFSMHDP